MFQNKSIIDNLITEDKLTEALAQLKPFCTDSETSNEIPQVLNQIIEIALNKGKIDIAIQASIYAQAVLLPNKGLQVILWNRIIHAINKAGGFSEIAFSSKLLKPSSYITVYLSEQLGAALFRVYQLFQKENWDIAGYEIKFAARHILTKAGEDNLVYQVRSIKGKGILLLYNGTQGHIENTHLINVAGLGFVAIKNIALLLHPRGIEIFKYSGVDWENELSQLKNHRIEERPNWTKVAELNSSMRQEQRKSTKQARAPHLNTVMTALQNELQEIEEIIRSKHASRVKKAQQEKQPEENSGLGETTYGSSLLLFHGREPEPEINDSSWSCPIL